MSDDMRGAEFVDTDLSGARFHNVNLTGVTAKEVVLVNARFSGLIHGLMINDVEVAPLIMQEMDRRYPERTKLRPTTTAGVVEAWSVIEQLWATTKARARMLPEEMLHERVDDEWSFVETLRHLVFVVDIWVSGTVLGCSGHHHPFGVAPTFITDVTPFGIDPAADPSFAEVVAVREDRTDIVRSLVSEMTDERLRERCGEHTVNRCLCTLFDEEWHHNWFANRDLDALEARGSD
jgi:hypothetical protein